VALEEEGWVTGGLVFLYVVSLQLVQTFVILKIVMYAPTPYTLHPTPYIQNPEHLTLTP